jgi:hypothetical protein
MVRLPPLQQSFSLSLDNPIGAQHVSVRHPVNLANGRRSRVVSESDDDLTACTNDVHMGRFVFPRRQIDPHLEAIFSMHCRHVLIITYLLGFFNAPAQKRPTLPSGSAGVDPSQHRGSDYRVTAPPDFWMISSATFRGTSS